MSAGTPHTMAARRAVICQVIATHSVASQEELGQLMADEGFSVTQATLSRDLDAIGAVKIADEHGHHIYSVLDATLIDTSIPTSTADTEVARLTADLLTRAEAAGNIAVLHTPPGAAQFYAGYIDRSSLGVIGSVAGDDTIIVVMRSADEAQALCDRLLRLAEQRRST